MNLTLLLPIGLILVGLSAPEFRLSNAAVPGSPDASATGPGTCRPASHLPANPNLDIDYSQASLREICLAGGCFWGVDTYLARIPGVAETMVGYVNGRTESPSYEDVIYRNTGHAETVRVKYDPQRISLTELLEHFFSIIDPTSVNRQGNDVGTQYRTGIYYTDPDDLPIIRQVMERIQKQYDRPLATEVAPLQGFYPAEEYHQKYLEKNPGGYCHVDLSPLKRQTQSTRGLVDPSLYSRPDDQTLRETLTGIQYSVTRQNATEPPHKNEFCDHQEPGLYVDVVTGEPLFSSRDKFACQCGWPSFARPIDPEVVTYHEDRSHGMRRIEVRSRVGDSHLGHRFEDGPRELGGLRYCINSAALRYIPLDRLEDEGYGFLKDHIHP